MSFFFFTTIPCLCPCHFDQFRFTGSPIKHFKCSHHHLFASRDHLSCSNHISGSHFSFLKQQIKPIWFLKTLFSTFFQVSFEVVLVLLDGVIVIVVMFSKAMYDLQLLGYAACCMSASARCLLHPDKHLQLIFEEKFTNILNQNSKDPDKHLLLIFEERILVNTQKAQLYLAKSC